MVRLIFCLLEGYVLYVFVPYRCCCLFENSYYEEVGVLTMSSPHKKICVIALPFCYSICVNGNTLEKVFKELWDCERKTKSLTIMFVGNIYRVNKSEVRVNSIKLRGAWICPTYFKSIIWMEPNLLTILQSSQLTLAKY